MAEKRLSSRLIHTHDIEAYWNELADFIPMQGEIIVYDIDASHDYERLKIGDGITPILSLPFINEHITTDEITEICQTDISVSEAEEV